ncbi:MAG TPA: beta-ketoacyl-ACP synthase II [Bacillota bacterium]|jgi:3-oxoacyl-[acyl-carrier-protein] synthase II|nr:beta-ketoacyl-ACP synthase II [Bacillota bacterium]HPT67455.1 beta-ketoacyl-ACP synthase II [Bacillota bacterium]
MTGKRRVVITGIGMVTPLGLTAGDTWQGIVEGRSGIGRITRYDPTPYPCQIAGEVKNFDPLNVLEKKELKKYDISTCYALAAVREAIADSGLDISACPDRVGVVVGSGMGGFESLSHYMKVFWDQGYQRVSPFFIISSIINTLPGVISIHTGAKGPNYSVVSACATGSHAIADAYHIIKRGEADIMITGGAEATVHPIAIIGFANIKALSTRNDEPERASRPFDRDRDGFVMGEGSGILILESLESAQARGAKIYAEVLGAGMNSDAHHITAPNPDGSGVGACMSIALKNAGLKPEDVDYINAHGTSTPLNDPTETKGIKLAFGEHVRHLAVSSTKSMTGHLLGASGAVEAIITALAIYHQILPPTINLDNPDPECDLDYVPHKARPGAIRAALSNSFGFGSTNVSLAFGRYQP